MKKKIFASVAWLLITVCAICQQRTSNAELLSGKNVRLKLERIEMVGGVQGDPERPFFRARLKIIDEQGKNVGVRLSKGKEALKNSIQITDIQATEGKKICQILFVRNLGSEKKIQGDGGEGESSSGNREIMMLVDVSGSMKNPLRPDKRSKFTVAKEAAKTLVDSLGSEDRIAVVPFSSLGVKKTINEAIFKAPAGAQEQIESLSKFEALINKEPNKYNTGLYGAIKTALDKLSEKKNSDPLRQYLLIVLTDGENEVKPDKGDDKDLTETIDDVTSKANEVAIPIYTIGVAPTQKLRKELKDIADLQKGEFQEVNDLDRLRGFLNKVQEDTSASLLVTFHSPTRTNYKEFKNVEFEVIVDSPDGQLTNKFSWGGGATGNTFAGKLSDLEIEALMEALKKGDLKSNETSLETLSSRILKLFLILGLFSAGLAFFWFVPPRLFWPEVAKPSLPKRDKQKTPLPDPKLRQAESSVENSLPPRPRHRFEETRVYNKRNQGED